MPQLLGLLAILVPVAIEAFLLWFCWRTLNKVPRTPQNIVIAVASVVLGVALIPVIQIVMTLGLLLLIGGSFAA